MNRPSMTREASSFLKLVLGIVLMMIIFAGGVYVGSRADKAPAPVAFLVKDKPTANSDEAESVIKANFYKKVDQAELDKGKQAGMVDALGDKFSHYLDGQLLSDFNTRTSGEYVGVGIQVEDLAKKVVITNVLAGSPAKDAGVKAGDVIVSVDEKSVVGQTATIAASKVRGEPGTKVSLTIERLGKPKTFSVTRRAVAVSSVQGREVSKNGDKYRYIYISNFSSSTGKDLEKQIQRAKARNNQGIVLDLRANGGGLVESSLEVGSFFLAKDTLMLSIKGRNYPEQKYSTQKAPIWNKPLVMVVDNQTASASEILASALQENKRAKIVGAKTYGKGVVQQMFPLSNGASIDLTVAEYFTSKGKSLTKVGVEPDVKSTDKRTTKTDEAYQTALDSIAK